MRIDAIPHTHLPGEGRGPASVLLVTGRRANLSSFRNWTPAFAGEGYRMEGIVRP
jgi:hypothetical protein